MKFIDFTLNDDSLLEINDKHYYADVNVKVTDDFDNTLCYIIVNTIPIVLNDINVGDVNVYNIINEYLYAYNINVVGIYIVYKDVSKYVLNNNMINVNGADKYRLQYIKPFIYNDTNIKLPKKTTADITITGGNFDDSMIFKIDDVIINSFNIISDSTIIINVTTPDTAIGVRELTISRAGMVAFGGSINLEIIDNVIGDGPSGEFLTDFNMNTSGGDLWGSSWVLETFGGASNIDGFFKSSNVGTPSGKTGPNSKNVFSYYNDRYMFTERSSENFGTGKYAIATTNYFSDLTKIELEYHRYGSSMADFIIECRDSFGSWIEKYRLSGQQQSKNNDVGTYVSIDTTLWDCDMVRFVFGEASNYDSDMAISFIKLTSV